MLIFGFSWRKTTIGDGIEWPAYNLACNCQSLTIDALRTDVLRSLRHTYPREELLPLVSDPWLCAYNQI